jgi:crotonobetainyl-CoA:carnitine CoA-transferase CaiB-like acyl-CoA transferase
MDAPLKGLRVVELARILAGPWIGQTLADLGADVIKVESPQGDDTRNWGPPFTKNADGTDADAAYFHSCNRGKRSVIANFEHPDDLAFVVRLINRADVVIENFKFRGLEKYGLDYRARSATNSRLVYCSVTGFGQGGPYAARAGYDAMIQGMSGIMDLTGSPDGEPQKIGVAFADIFTGVYGVVAIQAALAQREKTGAGQHIDLALLDVMVSVLANQALNFLVSGVTPHRLGNAHPNIVPYQTFPVSDGHVMIAVGNDSQFRRLCAVLGLQDLSTDPRYRSNADRVRGRAPLTESLSKALNKWRRAELLSKLEDEGVPAGPINTVSEVFADPQILFRKLKVDLPAASYMGGVIPTVRSPMQFSQASLAIGRSSPRLGEHTAEVKAEIEARDLAGPRNMAT